MHLRSDRLVTWLFLWLELMGYWLFRGNEFPRYVQKARSGELAMGLVLTLLLFSRYEDGHALATADT